MKNITMRVDEDVLTQARKVAAEQSTSVNALVRDFLEDLSRRESRKQTARREILDLCRRSKATVGGRTWTRDDLYEG
ncbi:MAG: DUF6364 family protein [Opitutales bacterium]